MSNFCPREVAGRGSETQFEVGDNLNFMIELIKWHCYFDVSMWRPFFELGE